MARIISICGAVLPVGVLPGDRSNPTGHWEPRIALDINDAFLRRHRSSWYDAGPTLQLEAVTSDDRAAFVREIAAFLSSCFHDGNVTVVKEPRISGLLPYWLAAVAALGCRAKLIQIFRHPDDVAASLRARDSLPADHSHRLWLKYNLFAEFDGRAAPRVFVAYEALLGNWESSIARCIRDLDLADSLRIDGSTRDAIEDFLRQDLRHHASFVAPTVHDRTVQAYIRRAYHLLHEAAEGRICPGAFDSLRTEYMRWLRALDVL